MQISTSKIVPCLWFDSEAEQAARFYVEVFPKSRIVHIAKYPEAGKEIHGRQPGSVLTVAFELQGQSFTALNGGPIFKFNEAISLQIMCDTQDELDHYTTRLSAVPEAEQCGWVKDRFGLSWQVVPKELLEMFADRDPAKVERAFGAMMQMKRLDIAQLRRAFEGR